MELLAVIVVGLVASVPLTVVALAVRQARFNRRLTELEASLRRIESHLASEPEPQASVSNLPAARKSVPAAKPLEEALPTTVSPTVFQPPPIEPPPVVTPAKPSPEAPPLSPEPVPVHARVVDWEKFLGVKLFAWVGGLALFLGIAFFIKYSFERNLIPPAVRVALGFVAGIGLVVGGVLMRRKDYAVTSHTLCATGIVVLYAVSFACHAVYQLIGSGPSFALMTLITAIAFTLAVRLDAKVVAVLGLVGGFLTPPLLSTGQDNPLGLFGYVTLLDLGLLAVALNRRWHFLLSLGVAGTGITELGWLFRFFQPEKTLTLTVVLALFNAVMVGGFLLAERLKQPNRETVIATVVQSAITFFAALYLINTPAMADRPGAILAVILIADVALLVLTLTRNDLFGVQLVAGGAALCTLASWLKIAFREEDLYWALGATLVFALLHSAYPWVLQRRKSIE